MTAPFAIVPYPLSSSYRHALEADAGEEIECLDVPALRRLGLRALVAELRTRRGRTCLLPLEDPASEALLPILEILAGLSGAARIEIVGPELERRQTSAAAALGAAGRLGLGSVRAQVAARRARRELGHLLDARRIDARARTPKVLYVNANLWYGVKAGGSVGHVAGVVNGLLDCGYAVDVAAIAPQPLVSSEAGFVSLPSPTHFGMPSEYNQYAFSQSTSNALAAAALGGSPGLVYQRLSFGTYAGVALSRRAGLPLVMEYNGSEVWVARNWGRPARDEQLALAAEDVSLRHAHAVVTVSSALGDELLDRGVSPDRLVVHPNGVDPDLFDPERLLPVRTALREELGVPANGVVVAFVGTFGRWHGAEVLAETVAALAERDPDWVARHGPTFVFVGDGLALPAVRETLGERGLEISRFTGLVPQLETPRYLAAADVVVSPHVPNEDGTPFFGSPTKLFEYMIMGKPIVASDLDQIGEVLRPAVTAEALPAGAPDNQLAVLTRPGDPSSLERGIRFLVENGDWRDALGAAARSRALEAYTWRHHVDAILNRLATLGVVKANWSVGS